MQENVIFLRYVNVFLEISQKKRTFATMMDHDILNDLNDGQRAAVEYCDGPQLVIAGAGSGKTRVLTYKIAYLLEQGMAPWNILALTFTNKAAREMKERIGKLVGQERAIYLQMGTFHSVFARILRAEAERIGFGSNFTIYDQADARSLVKSIIKEMQLDDKTYKPNSVADRISMAKNHLLLTYCCHSSMPSARGRRMMHSTNALWCQRYTTAMWSVAIRPMRWTSTTCW